MIWFWYKVVENGNWFVSLEVPEGCWVTTFYYFLFPNFYPDPPVRRFDIYFEDE